jgi:hypothetical protein
MHTLEESMSAIDVEIKQCLARGEIDRATDLMTLRDDALEHDSESEAAQ